MLSSLLCSLNVIFYYSIQPPSRSTRTDTHLPYTTLVRSNVPSAEIGAALDDGIGPAAGARIVEPDAFHRAKAQCFDPAFGHHLDRHAAFEIGGVGLPILEIGLVAVDQPLDEGVILVLVHRAVDIILAVADRPDIVPAARPPGAIGRAACRGRWCHYGEIMVVAV